MANLFSGKVLHTYGNHGSTLQLTLDYSYYRSGTTMYYSFSGNVKAVPPSGGSTTYGYKNSIQIKLDGTEVYSTSWTGSGSNWTWNFSANDKSVANKTTGTTAFYIRVWDSSGGGRYDWSNSGSSDPKTLPISPAASTISSTSSGYTLDGPTINITKYNNSFTDTIQLSYNNQTITKSNFSSGKVTFTEAERATIFTAQGENVSKSWSISGTTYSGGTSLGTYSGSVTITTEKFATVSPSSFDVPNNPLYSTTYTCGGKYSVYAYTSSDRSGTPIFSLTNQTQALSNQVASLDASSIYNSNTTSQNGTIYWRVTTSINNTQVGYKDTTCVYNFTLADCKPTLSTLNYKVTDAGTKALMNITNTYYAYNSGTNLDKFIQGKTTLGLQYQGSVASGKGSVSIQKYIITIPGQSSITKTTSSTSTQTSTTQVLSESGTITVTIYDTRGFYDSLSFTYSLNEYYDPQVTSMGVQRNPMSSTNVDIDKYAKISASISIPNYIATHLKNTNDYYIKYQYSTNGTTWTTGSDIKSGFTISGNTMYISNYQLSTQFDKNTQYYIRLYIKSYYVDNTYSNSEIIPISAPIISRRSGMVGINTVPFSHTLEVGGSMRANTTIESGTSITAGTSISSTTTVTSGTDTYVGGALYINGIKTIWYE